MPRNQITKDEIKVRVLNLKNKVEQESTPYKKEKELAHKYLNEVLLIIDQYARWVMTLPQQEHNSLIATREFLIDLMDPKKIPGVPKKVRLSARSLLKHYPTRLRLDELYDGETFESPTNNNKVVNNNQTWQTPGFKWKTEVEFIPNK